MLGFTYKTDVICEEQVQLVLFHTFTSPSQKHPLHISHKSQQGQTYANHTDFFTSLKPDILVHYVTVPEQYLKVLMKHKF